MAIKDEELRKMRAALMVQLKVSKGLNMSEVGKELGISRRTVEREMAFARKAELFASYEQQVIKDIVPLALEAVKTALKDGDSETAMKILNGLNIVPDPKAPKTVAEVEERDDLQLYIQKAQAATIVKEGTVDGQIISDSHRLAGLLDAGDFDETAAETTGEEATGTGTSVVETPPETSHS